MIKIFFITQKSFKVFETQKQSGKGVISVLKDKNLLSLGCFEGTYDTDLFNLTETRVAPKLDFTACTDP